MSELGDLRVCFLAGTLGQGGAERQLYYALRILRQCGAVPHLLTLTAGEYWEAPIRALGVPITWVGRSKLKMLRLYDIVTAGRSMGPAILQSQHFYTNLYAVAAARWLGVKEIGAVRNDVISEVETNGPLLGKLSLTVPRLVAANSAAAIQNAVRFGVPESRLFLLPNVVDTEHFRPKTKASSGAFRILLAGRLEPAKRVDLFLRVLARLRHMQSAPLVGRVVGDGSLRSALEQLARELGLLPDTVSFEGLQPDIADFLQDADALVLTSDYEGTPNVVLEAMASGVPVVATRAGGAPGLIEHERTGLMVDVRDEDGLTGAIIRLMQDGTLRKRLAVNARSCVEARYSCGSLVPYIERLYRTALETQQGIR